MNVALRKPLTREQFFDWAEAQDGRYEFDGFQPVAMTGGSVNHNQIALNIHVALRQRLSGSCRPLGPDAGMVTTGDKIRYPDALVTCTKVSGTEKLVPGVVVVFEVVSPTSSRTDRIDKVREYHAVASIRRYVLVEQGTAALTVHWREGEEPWRVEVLTEADTLVLPELGVDIPLREIYERVDFGDPADK